MNFGFSELLLILLIVLVIFGAGKLPKVMGDIGKGLRNLREELKTPETNDTNNDENRKSS